MRRAARATLLGGACLLACVAAASPPAERALTLSVESWSLGEALPVRSYFEGLEGDLDRDGRRAFTSNELRLAQVRGPWELSAFYRYDFLLRYDPETAEFFQRTQNDLPLAADRSYRIDLRGWHTEASGLALARRFRPHERVVLHARLGLLRATGVVDGRLEGRLAIDAAERIGGTARVDYGYTEDYLFDRPDVADVTAWGGTLDLGAELALTPGLTLAWQARDLVSALYWDGASRTRAVAASSTPTLAPDGVLDVRPVLSGVETEEDFRQTLPVRQRLRLSWSSADGPLELSAEVRHLLGGAYLRTNASWALTPGLRLLGTLGLTTRAVGLGVRTNWGGLFLLADDPDPDEARTVELRAMLRHEF